MDASSPPKIMLDLIPSVRMAGPRLVDAGEVNQIMTLQSGYSALNGVGVVRDAAHVIGTGVTNLNAQTGQTAVALPPGLPGMVLYVYNSGAAAGLVFGYTANDLVEGAASASVAAGAAALLVCVNRVPGPPVVATWKVLAIA